MVGVGRNCSCRSKCRSLESVEAVLPSPYRVICLDTNLYMVHTYVCRFVRIILKLRFHSAKSSILINSNCAQTSQQTAHYAISR